MSKLLVFSYRYLFSKAFLKKLIICMTLFVGVASNVVGQVDCNLGVGYTEIQGNFDSPNLYGNGLLSPAQAQNTPQFLKITGLITFTEDYTFAPGSDIIFLDNNSGFRVNSAITLTLNKSLLRGCNKLWRGVEMIANSIIVSDKTQFEDAITAILLRRDTRINLTENTFRKNVCGVLAVRENPFFTTPISVLLATPSGLTGNRFYGDEPLLEAFSISNVHAGLIDVPPANVQVTYPYTGIWLQRVANLKIGHTNYDANVFENYAQFPEVITTTGSKSAIRSIESNVLVTNCTFNNIGTNGGGAQTNIVGRAISARSFSTTTLPFTKVMSCRFDNCYMDIRSLGTELTVTDIYSERALQCIRAGLQSSSQNPTTWNITNNRILNFRAVGIQIDLFKPLRFDISENLLSDIDEDNNHLRRAIIVRNATGFVPEINLIRGNVTNNEIMSRSVFDIAFFGIQLERVAYLTVEQNRIYEELASSDLLEFYGIISVESPCNGTRVLYNDIEAAGINYPLVAFGTLFNESVNGVFRCNNLDNLNTGMCFTRNCDNTDLRENEFHYHNAGLSIGHQLITTSSEVSQIGLQTNKENRWHGTTSAIEAYAQNQGSALASIFEINSSNLSSVFWPYPRKIGTIDDNFTWFLPSTTGPEADETLIDCYLEEEEHEYETRLADNDLKLIDGVFEPYLNFPALVWEAQWQFAGRLNRNPQLQTISPQVSQYYNDTYDETFSNLNRIYQAYINRWNLDHPIVEQIELLRGELKAANQERLDLLNNLSNNIAENVSLYEDILEIDILIADKQSVLETAIIELNNQVDITVGQLLDELELIEVEFQYESDMKMLIETLLNAHLAGGELTELELANMEHIANKCRYSGGYAVLLARTFFEPQESYPQDLICEENTPNTDLISPESTELSSFRVFPNPTNEKVNLVIEQAFDYGTIHLYNAQGVLLKSFNLEHQSYSINVNDLKNGLYFLEVQLNGENSTSQSFIVTR